jgi:hypothetical protein
VPISPISLLAGRADRLEHLAGAGGVALKHPFGGADLQHDHAEAVGDDVVELARDPLALLGGRLGRASLLLAVELLRPLLQGTAACANCPPGQADPDGENGEAR